MRTRSLALVVTALAFAVTAAASAQGIMGEMHRDVNEVQEKFINLAKAIPETAFGWRPSAGARSVGEVLLHVASDNYLIPRRTCMNTSASRSRMRAATMWCHRGASSDVS